MKRIPLLPLAALFALLLPAARCAADSLLVTEAVTDPESDHSESAGGNGAPYDAVPGTGTVSSVDEFVEIYNGGRTAVDLTGYVLEFLDTSPETYVFGASTGGVLLLSAGAALDLFPPGAYLLLGNPPGALNNAIDIVLRDPAGGLVDVLSVADGAATSPLDESVARVWDGASFGAETRRAPVSPLGPGARIPEPAALLLLGLSACLGALATARRGRRGPRRRRRGTRPPPPSPRRSPAGSAGWHRLGSPAGNG